MEAVWPVTTIEGSQFTHNGVYWRHLEFTNCKSQNVIYALVCTCPKIYVGKTNQQVNQRITQHRSRIKKKVVTAPVVQHFVEKGHTERDFKWTVLHMVDTSKNVGDIECRLLKKEAYLILKYNAMTAGLNEMTELSRT